MKAVVEMDCGSYVVVAWMPESRNNLDDVAWRALLSFGQNEGLAKKCAKVLSEQMWNEAQLFEFHRNYNVKHVVLGFDWECHNTGRAVFNNIEYEQGDES